MPSSNRAIFVRLLLGFARSVAVLLTPLWLTCVQASAEPSIIVTVEQLKSIPGWYDLDRAIGTSWFQDDFAGLERELSQSTDIIGGDGTPKQELAFISVDAIVDAEGTRHPSQSGRDAFLKKWQEKFPRSAAPKIVRALYLVNYAANNPDRTPGAGFSWSGYIPRNSGLDEADAALRDAKPAAAKYPYWFTVATKIAKLRKQAYGDVFILADQSKTAAPGHLEARFEFLDYLADNLFWPPDKLNAMVRSLSEKGGMIDSETYARLCLHLFTKHPRTEFYGYVAAEWPVLKTGLGKLTDRYPTRRILNERAALTCLTGDLNGAKPLFAAVAGGIDHDVWQLPEFYNACTEWAAQ